MGRRDSRRIVTHCRWSIGGKLRSDLDLVFCAIAVSNKGKSLKPSALIIRQLYLATEANIEITSV
jgi:hypothetical protein